ncbi:hypothetical protein CLV71_104113 [Actinophytocola oryzae]|uniref:Uncharacterized protein n=2 Tax=Actinophytocola oryzae TaxID=502181 RepID=A0A4R7VVJ8_9PSEU|nr:hypothetical protein CLV71_104113 [Actinophytocola oryzae]
MLGHYTGIELTSFHAADLDVDPPKVRDYSPLEFLETIGTNTGELTTPNYHLVLFPPGPALTYDECRSATRYTGSVGLDQLVNGSQICVTTDKHRIALLMITHTPTPDDQPQYIRFDATVWQGPLGQ